MKTKIKKHPHPSSDVQKEVTMTPWQKKSTTLFRERCVSLKNGHTKIMLIIPSTQKKTAHTLSFGYTDNTPHNFYICNQLSKYIIEELLRIMTQDQYAVMAAPPRKVRKIVAATFNAFINKDWKTPPQLADYDTLSQTIVTLLKQYDIQVALELPSHRVRTPSKEPSSWSDADKKMIPMTKKRPYRKKKIHLEGGVYLSNKKEQNVTIRLHIKKKDPLLGITRYMGFDTLANNESNNEKIQRLLTYVLEPFIYYLWIKHPNYCSRFFDEKELQQEIKDKINKILHQTSLTIEQLKELCDVVLNRLDRQFLPPVVTELHDIRDTIDPDHPEEAPSTTDSTIEENRMVMDERSTSDFEDIPPKEESTVELFESVSGYDSDDALSYFSERRSPLNHSFFNEKKIREEIAFIDNETKQLTTEESTIELLGDVNDSDFDHALSYFGERLSPLNSSFFNGKKTAREEIDLVDNDTKRLRR